jgi:tripartite-type tricarboxylate transporter receptor subunit TctC
MNCMLADQTGNADRDFRSAPFGMTMVAAFCAIVASAPAHAGDFYAGKTIDFLVGADAGGGYDIYARAVARHWGKYIPGHPTFVIRNLPGAGSGRAAVFISTVAPKDGTAIGAIMPGAIVGPLLDDKPQAGFDPTKVQYLGTADSGVRVCVTMKDSKTKTFAEALTQKTIMGATGGNGSSGDYANLHKHTSGAKFDVVGGYQGTVSIGLAMERGELDGVCGWDWSSLKSQKADWIKNNKVNVLVQVGLDPDPELTKMGVPPIWDFVKSEEARKVVELVVSQQVFMRSYIAPPGTPPDRIEILRHAFDQTVKDPEFLADAKRMRIAIEPLSGEKVQDLVTKLYATPKDIVAEAKKAIKP